MIDIIGKKNWFFILSGIIIIPGIISMVLYGLNFGIDFTGGSRLEYQANNSEFRIQNSELEKIITEQGVEVVSVRKTKDDTFSIRTKPIDEKTHREINKALSGKFKSIKETSFETVGPIIGAETKVNAIKAVLIATVAILLYIAFVFREVSRPISSWKYGVCAIVALLHDILVVVGIFSILGHFASIEVDSLFITALLTVMGFSVHDTIVVFDRIRENLKKNTSLQFGIVVNNSILETLTRSLNTSLTVVIVLSILLLFSGEALRWFIVALLVGIISGTYSSIFNASPLLVVWHEWSEKRKPPLI